MINEGISIVALSEVNINWSKSPIKENIYNRNYEWVNIRIINTG